MVSVEVRDCQVVRRTMLAAMKVLTWSPLPPAHPRQSMDNLVNIQDIFNSFKDNTLSNMVSFLNTKDSFHKDNIRSLNFCQQVDFLPQGGGESL